MKYQLIERDTDGPGVSAVLDIFDDPDEAFLALVTMVETYPDLYGGVAPVNRLLVKESSE